MARGLAFLMLMVIVGSVTLLMNDFADRKTVSPNQTEVPQAVDQAKESSVATADAHPGTFFEADVQYFTEPASESVSPSSPALEISSAASTRELEQQISLAMDHLVAQPAAPSLLPIAEPATAITDEQPVFVTEIQPVFNKGNFELPEPENNFVASARPHSARPADLLPPTTDQRRQALIQQYVTLAARHAELLSDENLQSGIDDFETGIRVLTADQQLESARSLLEELTRQFPETPAAHAALQMLNSGAPGTDSPLPQFTPADDNAGRFLPPGVFRNPPPNTTVTPFTDTPRSQPDLLPSTQQSTPLPPPVTQEN